MDRWDETDYIPSRQMTIVIFIWHSKILTLSAPSCFGPRKKKKRFMNRYSEESFYARELSLGRLFFFFFFFFSQVTERFPRTMKINEKNQAKYEIFPPKL